MISETLKEFQTLHFVTPHNHFSLNAESGDYNIIIVKIK